MNKIFLFLIIVLCAIAQLCYGLKPVTYDPPNTHPSHPNHCYSMEKDKAFRIGEKYTDKDACQLVKCETNLGFKRTSCDNRRPMEGCEKSKIDSTKDYPDCCPKIKCGPVKIDF